MKISVNTLRKLGFTPRKSDKNKYQLIYKDKEIKALNKIKTFNLFTSDISDQPITVYNKDKTIVINDMETLVDYTIGISIMQKKIKSFFK